MRTETEMMDLILHTAKTDDRVLAAYLKGSRTNPHVPKDRYQDFDIMYVVRETRSFIADPSWMDGFGKIILKQEQNDDFGYGDRFGIRSHYEQSYSWLLLFEDGNRIDIGVETVEAMEKGINRNKLFLPLLDKTGCLPKLPPPTDEDFHVTPPTAKQFRGCCNTFFWSLCDVVKGIARDELPFAMTTYHTLAHSMLQKMLGWYIGVRTDYSVSSASSISISKRICRRRSTCNTAKRTRTAAMPTFGTPSTPPAHYFIRPRSSSRNSPAMYTRRKTRTGFAGIWRSSKRCKHRKGGGLRARPSGFTAPLPCVLFCKIYFFFLNGLPFPGRVMNEGRKHCCTTEGGNEYEKGTDWYIGRSAAADHRRDRCIRRRPRLGTACRLEQQLPGCGRILPL